MKTTCLLFSLLLVSVITSAQETGNSAVVAATNLNVLYLGIPNPIEIAVPGITSDKITAVITNGTIQKTAKGWEVSPSSLSDVVITVIANNIKVTDKVFRVKPVPLPVAVFAGITNGAISKSAISGVGELKVELKDFLWDMNFQIQSFTLLISQDGSDKALTSQSNLLTDEMKTIIAGLKQGQYVTFKDIKAKGPDGRMRDLSPLIIKLD